MVEARSIAEEFTSLSEKFLLLEGTRISQSTNLDVMGRRNAVVVAELGIVADSTAFMGLAVAVCSREHSLRPSCHHSSSSCSLTTAAAFIVDA